MIMLLFITSFEWNLSTSFYNRYSIVRKTVTVAEHETLDPNVLGYLT